MKCHLSFVSKKIHSEIDDISCIITSYIEVSASNTGSMSRYKIDAGEGKTMIRSANLCWHLIIGHLAQKYPQTFSVRPSEVAGGPDLHTPTLTQPRSAPEGSGELFADKQNMNL